MSIPHDQQSIEKIELVGHGTNDSKRGTHVQYTVLYVVYSYFEALVHTLGSFQLIPLLKIRLNHAT